MIETWKLTRILRKKQLDLIKELYPSWVFYGCDFTSWIWIDTKNSKFNKILADICKLNGVPIRLGTSGYMLPSYIRIAVRSELSFKHLYCILKDLKCFYCNSIIVSYDMVDINSIIPHELIIESKADALYDFLTDKSKIAIPAIIVDSFTCT